MSRFVIFILASFCLAASAIAADTAPSSDPPIRKLDGHLVDIKGRGLYTFDGDTTPGMSSCNSQCRLLWPPIKAEPGAKAKGPFTVAEREDGTMQWALRGKPLYRWASDKNYGDAGGDGVSDKWHLVKVAPAKPPAPAAAAAASPATTPATPAATPAKPD